MKASFRVTVTLPEHVTIDDMRTYIHESIQTMVGSYSPEEPLFDLDRDSVKVSRITKRRKETSAR